MLSTPPAFILSQDQTLDKSFLRQNNVSCSIRYCFRSLFVKSCSQKILILKEFSKTFQSTIQLSKFMCCLLALATALIAYQIFSSLSTTFFNFFRFDFTYCPAVLAVSLIIIALLPGNVNTFFIFFLDFLRIIFLHIHQPYHPQ